MVANRQRVLCLAYNPVSGAELQESCIQRKRVIFECEIELGRNGAAQIRPNDALLGRQVP